MWQEDGPACGVETEAARAAGYDGDFALEGEYGGEVLELNLFCGGHFVDVQSRMGCWKGRWAQRSYSGDL